MTRFFSVLALATVCFLAAPEPASSQSTPSDPGKTDVPAAGSDQPAAPETTDGGEAEQQTTSEAPLSETEQWAQRLETLLDGLRKGKKERMNEEESERESGRGVVAQGGLFNAKTQRRAKKARRKSKKEGRGSPRAGAHSRSLISEE